MHENKPCIPDNGSLKIVLVEPQIPPNIGAISRVCACIGAPLYIVGKLAFDENHPKRKRAGLDYWDLVEKIYVDSMDELLSSFNGRFFLLSTKVGNSIYKGNFQPGDALIFGSETKGLEEKFIKKYEDKTLRIPMVKDVRSLNLANAVAIAAFEALRQIHSL
jgi:tRNA (cytidine/uridine-2'-O-)-methyltransferase